MKNLLKNNQAFALTFGLIFMFLIVSFMAVYILSVANGLSQANRAANLKRAYYIADAGLADAYERINQAGANIISSSTCTDTNKPSTCSSPYIPAASTDNGTYAVGSANGKYTVSVVYSKNPQTNYTITSTGTYGNISKTLQLKITAASVNYYAYWSQTEINPAFNGPIYWIGMPGIKMLSDGPIHTNGQLNIYGNPRFNNAVQESNLPILADGSLGTTPTSNSPNYFGGIGNNSNGVASDPSYIFKGGLQNDAPPDNLVLQNTLNSVKSTAGNGSGLLLTGASTILFNHQGTVSITGAVVDSNCHTVTTYNNTTINPPANGVIFVQSTSAIPACQSTAKDGNATVQGTVKGQLTIGSDQSIYLTGGVGYNSDPRISPNSKDLLGMVANQNIVVVEGSSPAALEISGVLVAVNGSFSVDQYWAPKGNATLDQFGSLINYVSGSTGVLDLNGNLLGGWNEIQHWDARFGTTVPPGFPPYYMANGGALYSKLSFAEL